MMEKMALRRHFRALLQEKNIPIHSEEQAQRAEALTTELIQFLKSEGGIWSSFIPLSDEPNPNLAVEASTHIQWVYPRIDQDRLRFFRSSVADCTELNSWGVLEPPEDQVKEISLHEISGFLVPGLAFDRRGARLGRGKAYFDRTLKGLGGKRVGLAYDYQISQTELPTEDHDEFMDIIVTSGGLIKKSAGKL